MESAMKPRRPLPPTSAANTSKEVKEFSSSKGHVQVAVRLRPKNENERDDTLCVRADGKAKAVSIRNKTFAGFDAAYDASITQAQVYKELVAPQIEDVLKGYNCTVFAYGQTGTGKTYTMEGGEGSREGDWDTDPDTGIIPRAVQHIFASLGEMETDEFVVRVSFVEIYNEEMVDLLVEKTDNNQRIRMYEDPAKKGAVMLCGVEEVPVRCRDDVYKLLRQGTERRQTAETIMNLRSSRSHSVFTINVVIRETTASGEELVKQGKLRLVDLAGSENIGRSGAEGKRAKEAGNINTSLLTLGRVITALTSNGPHVPYRESKLTRLLQDSLGGSTITTIIATLSPVSRSFEESLSTLEYAHRAKNIKNHPEINQKLSRKDMFKEYAGEIERLRRDLRAAREKNGIYLDEEQYEGMERKMTVQEERIQELEGRLDSIMEKHFRFITDMAMMDDLYTRAYARTRALEDRLAHRIKQLEERSLELAEEKVERAAAERALQKCREYADEAFQGAQKLYSQARSAQSECGMLHARADAIVAMARDNEGAVEQLRQAVEEAVPGYKKSVQDAASEMMEQLASARAMLDAFAACARPDHENARAAVAKAEAAFTDMLTTTGELDYALKDERTRAAAAAAKEITEAKDKLEEVLKRATHENHEAAAAHAQEVSKLREHNEALIKENAHWRGVAREHLQKENRERDAADLHLQEGTKRFHEQMLAALAAWRQSADEGRAAIVQVGREAEEAVHSAMEQQESAHRSIADQMDEQMEALAAGLTTASEHHRALVATATPQLERVESRAREAADSTAKRMKEWQTARMAKQQQATEQVAEECGRATAAIERVQAAHEHLQNTAETVHNAMGAAIEEGRSVATRDFDASLKMVATSAAKIKAVPDKAVDSTDRDLEEVDEPPTEQQLYAEEGEEENDEERADEFTEDNRRAAMRRPRRSAFRVRDSILVAREGDELYSPSKVATMKQSRIDEEEPPSFGSDRTNTKKREEDRD